MKDSPAAEDAVRAIALLDEPNRRRVFDFVTASSGPAGRDDTAAELGMSRELAAFHLDRLVDGGLLETEFRRRSGRTGPGAGRPAKLYRRAPGDLSVSFPPRRYDRAAELLAEGIDRLTDSSAADAVRQVARERGTALGLEARQAAGRKPSRRRLQAALMDLLRRSGYEPVVDATSRDVRLRSCPYDAIAANHRDLTCGMNLAWAEGVTDAMGSSLVPRLDPQPGQCCVAFRQDARASRTPSRDQARRREANDAG